MHRIAKLMLILAVLASAALPAAAQDELVVPEACDDRKLPVLEEDEILVEHTLFLHAGVPVAGDAGDGYTAVTGDDSNAGFMDGNAPTLPVASVNASASPNYDFHQNPLMAYWTYDLPEPQRIVCFGAQVWAVGGQDPAVQLWIDDPYAVDGATRDGDANARVGDGEIAEITTRPTSLDVEGFSHLTLQVGSLAGGYLYDSTLYPANFTYVTVETVES